MPSPTQSPPLFPSFVAQHSIVFDPADPTDFAAQYPGVSLPLSLDRAVRKRQAEFLAGRFCARRALEACAPEHAARTIAIGANREPLWPAGIVGAITHTAGFASVAVARAEAARGIGLDAERIMHDDQAERILEQIAAPAEVAAIARRTGWSHGTSLTAIFSAKETIFKCLYPEVKRYFDFREAWVDAFSDGRFQARLLIELTPALRAGHPLEGRYELSDGLVCTAIVVA